MFDRFIRRSRKAWVGLTLCAGISGAVLAGTAGTASADPYIAPAGATHLAAASDNLLLDVAGASAQPGAPVIQWPDNGGNNQYWNVPRAFSVGVVQNLNSGQCLTTDGVAGDQLFQWPCDPNLAAYQDWDPASYNVSGVGVVEEFVNGAFGLRVDVGGDSSQPGTPIIAWPYNGSQPNQQFLPLSLSGGV
jgi:hypothetical protein